MNKQDLVNSVAKETGLSKVKTTETINAIMDAITTSLSKGEKVTLVGFGTFSTTQRKARRGRNPKTGQVINIPAKVATRFKAGSDLSKNVN